MRIVDWIRQLLNGFQPAPSIPEGWTDDMTIQLPQGRTEAEVVEFVIQAAVSGTSISEIDEQLATEFNLSPDDAELARDRTFGGIVRAGTRLAENCPSRVKDPIAWESYQRGTDDPSLIERVYLQNASRKKMDEQS